MGYLRLMSNRCFFYCGCVCFSAEDTFSETVSESKSISEKVTVTKIEKVQKYPIHLPKISYAKRKKNRLKCKLEILKESCRWFITSLRVSSC